MKTIRTLVTYTAPPSACMAAFVAVVAALDGNGNLVIVCGLLAVVLLALDMWVGRQ